MANLELRESYQRYSEASPATNNRSPPAYLASPPPPNFYDLSASEGEENGTSGDQRSETEEQLVGWEGVHRRLSIDNESDTSSVDEHYHAASISSSIEDQLTWRGRMQLVLHSHKFHYFIVFLVVLDALIVLFELLLDVGAFGNRRCDGEGLIEQAEFCHFDSESRDECAPPAYLILEGINISSPPLEGTPGSAGICRCRFRAGKFICRDADTSLGINPGLILHFTSIGILTIFILEILSKFIAFRLKYFAHKFEVFDGMVVVISWILDIASLKEEAAFEALSLLIILRLWRVVRIVNGAVLSSKVQSDNQLKEARREARHVIHALHKSQDRVKTLEDENDKLKQTVSESQGVSAETTSSSNHDEKPDTAENGEGLQAVPTEKREE